MSDRPSEPLTSIPDEPRVTGGWRKPAGRSIWQPPPAAAQAEPATFVPSLPSNVGAQPEAIGGWHLPKPEDTTVNPEDVVEVRPAPAEALPTRPEDIIFPTEETAVEEAAPQATEAAPVADVSEAVVPSGDTAAAETADEQTGALENEPTTLLDLEREPVSAEEENGFSMSELLALASLVDQTPQARLVPGTTTVTEAPPDDEAQPTGETSPATRGETGQQAAVSATQTDTQAEAEDPAAYARRQLEQLGVTGGATGTGIVTGAAAPTEAEDPAAYARRQLEQLGVTGGATGTGIATGAAAPVPAALTPEQEELARRYRETQEQVRALRAAYQAGQITRDDLQNRLRQLMILDENRVWWMMGLETDTWYKFDNGEWIPATPPVLNADEVSPPQRGVPPTITSGLNPDEVIGGSLPLVGEEEQPVSFNTQPSAQFRTPPPEEYGMTGYAAPVPQPGTPVQDPDYTVVGNAGAYLEPVRSSEAPTLQNMSAATADTLRSPRVDIDAGSFVAAPIPTEEAAPPEYNLEQAAPTYDEIARRQQTQLFGTVVRVALVLIGLFLLVAAGAIILLVIKPYNDIAAQYQPQIAALANYQPAFQTARILDVNNNLIAELNSPQGGARSDVPLEKISPFMIHAVLSSENSRYWEDPGFDWISIGRAFAQNLSTGNIESGASTITQQIARQLVLQDTSISSSRKIQEIVIAAKIAEQYSKNQILQLYLNEIYFGNQNYGVEAASQFYFGHSANDLNLPEAALLTAMIAAPASYDPVRHIGEDNATYNARRTLTFNQMKTVIAKMQSVGCLATREGGPADFCVNDNVVRQARAQQAVVEATRYEPRQISTKYPHFVQFVRQLVERDFGAGTMYQRGFVIKTTLNPAIQDAAQTALSRTVAAIQNTGIDTGSVMVTDPRTGAIRAMVGSPDFNNQQIDGQVNTALTWQQPGSAIKPVVYTAALEGVDTTGDGVPDRYMTPASIIWDVPTTFNTNPPYTPTNFQGQGFAGPIALRYALQQSRNIPAVKTYDFIGADKFRDTATRMGLRFREDAQFGLATGIGATEVTLYDMMVAYGTLANGGVKNALYAIDSITDSSGIPLDLPQRVQGQAIVQPQIAFLMQNILSDDSARAPAFPTGANSPLNVPNYAVAAKTGTTNDTRDLWTMGFTRNAVVGVWLGNHLDRPTFVQGGGFQNVAPLWNQVMQAALKTMPNPGAFPNPGGLVQAQICADTGTLPPANCSSLRPEIFVQSEPPPGADQAFVRQVSIDAWTGLIANEYCRDNIIQGTFVNIPDAAAVSWLNSAAGAATAQRLGITASTLQTVPNATCDANTDIPIAVINFPPQGQTLTGTVQVTGAATARTFSRYQLEVASATAPNTFTIVSGPTTTPQTAAGPLGTWDTTRTPNGPYILRLAMFASNGGYLYRTVTVNVANVLPTATPVPIIPTLPPTVPPFSTTPFPQTDFTPLPFETVPPG
jgi:membrane peptidoglycan carboxypeptidase